jgi:hypothetical protein
MSNLADAIPVDPTVDPTVDHNVVSFAMANQCLMDLISKAKNALKHYIDVFSNMGHNQAAVYEADQKRRDANAAAVSEIDKLFGDKLTLAGKWALFSTLTKNT